MQHYKVEGYDVAAPNGECWCVDLEQGRVIGRFDSFAKGDEAGVRCGRLYTLISDPTDTALLPENTLRALCQEVDTNPKTSNIGEVVASLLAALRELRFMEPGEVIARKSKESTMSNNEAPVKRNGNTARVHEICNELYNKHGNKLTRKMAVEACEAEGIPTGTASTQWHRWRTANGYEAPKAQKEGAAA